MVHMFQLGLVARHLIVKCKPCYPPPLQLHFSYIDIILRVCFNPYTTTLVVGTGRAELLFHAN